MILQKIIEIEIPDEIVKERFERPVNLDDSKDFDWLIYQSRYCDFIHINEKLGIKEREVNK